MEPTCCACCAGFHCAGRPAVGAAASRVPAGQVCAVQPAAAAGWRRGGGYAGARVGRWAGGRAGAWGRGPRRRTQRPRACLLQRRAYESAEEGECSCEKSGHLVGPGGPAGWRQQAPVAVLTPPSLHPTPDMHAHHPSPRHMHKYTIPTSHPTPSKHPPHPTSSKLPPYSTPHPAEAARREQRARDQPERGRVGGRPVRAVWRLWPRAARVHCKGPGDG